VQYSASISQEIAMQKSSLDLAKDYIAAVERGAVGAELAAFFAPDVQQREFPNRLVPNGSRTDLAGMLAAAERGQSAVRDQRYSVTHAVENGAEVALEVEWSAQLLKPVGALQAGATMKAYYALFITFRADRIVSVRNYDCFEPF
jgi:ketosteroid isomerase-like protein